MGHFPNVYSYIFNASDCFGSNLNFCSLYVENKNIYRKIIKFTPSLYAFRLQPEAETLFVTPYFPVFLKSSDRPHLSTDFHPLIAHMTRFGSWQCLLGSMILLLNS